MDSSYIGIDIGKTKIIGGIIREDGKIIHKERAISNWKNGGNDIFDQAIVLTSKLVKEIDGHVLGIGIGTFGVVDSENGVILKSSATVDKPSFEIKKHFEERFELPIRVDNDVCVGALGEHKFGAGRGTTTSVSIIIGTGTGVGVIINNKIWHGAHFLAGQVGWVGSPEEGMSWEDFTSGRGIAKRAKNLIKNELTTEDIFTLAEKNDELSKRIIDDAVRYAASEIVLIQNLIDPEIIIVGGGVANKQKKFVGRIIKKAYELHDLPKLDLNKDVRITKSELGENSVIVGGAALFIS